MRLTRTPPRLSTTRTGHKKFLRASMQSFHRVCAHHNPAPLFPQSRPNPGRQCSRDDPKIRVESTRQKGMGMTEQQQRLAKEREEIASRVARFKATQEKFEREREEYFVTTLRSACEGKPIHSWS